MKKPINLLYFTAIAIILATGAIASAQAAGLKSNSFSVGIVIGGEERTVVPTYNYNARYTCGSAKTKLQLAGFSEIKTLKCSGNIYSFTAWTHSHRANVGFHALSGEILYF